MRRDPQDNLRELHTYTLSQSGLFTAGQAQSAGYSRRQQHYHTERGNWERIDRGIYRLRDYPYGDQDDLVVATLWSRNKRGTPQGVISHETALVVHDMSDVSPARIHITVPPGFRKRSGGYVLHRAVLANDDSREHAGYRVTTPLRTLLDVAAGTLSREHVHAAVRDALRKGLVPLSLLEAAGEPLAEALRLARES